MYQRILVAVDGSATSNQALSAAIALAQRLGSQLRVVHVVEEMAYLSGYDQFGGYSGELLRAMREAGTRILQDAIGRAHAAGVAADSVLFDRFGERLAESVSAAARLWQAELVVVGTHGRKGLSRVFMGSGAEQVIRRAEVPVLVIRGTQPEEDD